MTENKTSYEQKKQFYSQLLTIYGRKPVLEALQHPSVNAYRLHLAESNKSASIISEIISLAKNQNAEILHHSRESLSRISKNKKQDQGVAVDLKLHGYCDISEFIDDYKEKTFELIATDKITNPQNLGMIIRSVCASPLTGILLPTKGCAKLDALVIKASAGTLFKCKIIRCETLEDAFRQLRTLDTEFFALDASAKSQLKDIKQHGNKVFVLGNESDGVAKNILSLCKQKISIPMCNNVESLNVAITAALIAFRQVLGDK